MPFYGGGGIKITVRFRSPVLGGNWINMMAHKTWCRLYFFLMFFLYQVIYMYQKACQILGFLNIHELGISWNANFHKMGIIHDIWEIFLLQNV